MWAAEGMAVRMAQAEMATHGSMAEAAMPEDCPMMAKAASGHVPAQGDADPLDHASCGRPVWEFGQGDAVAARP